MSIIKAENVTFSYPGSYDDVFTNVSFQIDTDWRLGFIGRNGRGKTTFLKLLTGELKYEGKIISSVKFDYFPYTVSDKTLMTYDIVTLICPSAEDWELIREISYLNVKADVLYRPFETLSNGEQTKVLLSALFLNNGNFLLIDEPTNHLDAEARETVAAYLKKKKGFILVSHDREFLDGCVDHILSLNKNSIDVQSGNYTVWKTNFDNCQNYEAARNEHLQKDIKRLQDASKRNADWSARVERTKNNTTSSGSSVDRGFVGHKAAKMMQRSKNIELRRQRQIEEKSQLLKNAEKNELLRISPQLHYASELVFADRLYAVYNGNAVNRPVSFCVKTGDRIALTGKNGCGKSSILKILLGKDIQYSGTVKTTSGLIISYVSQDTSSLCGTLDEYARLHNIDETLFKAILRKMDFERVQFEKDIYSYSGGQKKKVLIAKSLCEKAHLYIWDEPLNFIDVYSRIQIEDLILQYKPTMIFVEHDKAFCRNISTDTVHIESNM